MKKIDPKILEIIGLESTRQGVEASYVKALIFQESGARTLACRYEPGWSYFQTPEFFANKLGQTVETEMMQQKFSYGLMQVMGGTARELGFAGYLPELLSPALGVHYGVLYLAKQVKRYGNYLDAISAYNAGVARKIGARFGNQDYVDSVMRLRSEFL